MNGEVAKSHLPPSLLYARVCSDRYLPHLCLAGGGLSQINGKKRIPRVSSKWEQFCDGTQRSILVSLHRLLVRERLVIYKCHFCGMVDWCLLANKLCYKPLVHVGFYSRGKFSSYTEIIYVVSCKLSRMIR